jgi:hypothetical protein
MITVFLNNRFNVLGGKNIEKDTFKSIRFFLKKQSKDLQKCYTGAGKVSNIIRMDYMALM